MCSCHDSEEGIFCRGGGVAADGRSVVARFLGVWSESRPGGGWSASLAAYNNTRPFADRFEMEELGGPSNYTGVSQALGDESFVWRGRMSGVSCAFRDKCAPFCGEAADYAAWASSCPE